MRAAAHYVFILAVISLYGGEVCPYIAHLDFINWLVLLVVVLALFFTIRYGLISGVVLGSPFESQTKRQFIVELSLFFSASVTISAYNSIVYGFPTGSGLKIVLGTVALGFFAAVDIALDRQRSVSRELSRIGREITISEKFFPLTGKLAVVASFTVVMVTGIAALVIVRDLSIITGDERPVLGANVKAVLFELVFIGIVVLIEIINLIVSFSMNLKMFFGNENSTLIEVSNGDIGGRVTVSTNDEFGFMACHTNRMIESLRERTRRLELTQDVTIITLASLAETRDNETGAHILRTQRYVRALAGHLTHNPRFADFLSAQNIDLLYKSAPLHDIGKVGVRDAILLKPGKLTEEEFVEMKKHTVYGRDAIFGGEKMLGSNSFLTLAREIAYTHHEKWDGSGYPEGLAGSNIPLSGRLMALADVYDALISKRVYKPPFSHKKAVGIIIDGNGKHFDPDIIDAFIEIEDDFRNIAVEFANSSENREILLADA